MTVPAGGETPAGGAGGGLGLFRFTTEARAAPGLFVVGWLATLLGLIGVAVGIFGGPRLAGPAFFVAGAASLTVGLCGLAGSQAIERRAAGLIGYRGPSPVLIFLAWLPASYVAWVAIGVPLELAGIRPGQLATELLFLVVQSAIALGLVRLLVVGPGALTWPEIGYRRGAARALMDVAWGALLAGPAILVTAIVATVLLKVVGVAPESPLPPTGTAGGLAVHLLAGAVIAPVAEETIFRGVAVTAWRTAFGSRSAVVGSAVLFAAAHVLFVGGDSFGAAVAAAAVGFLGRLPIALFLGWTFVPRGSIWAPIGLHAAFNGVLITAAELLAGVDPGFG